MFCYVSDFTERNAWGLLQDLITEMVYQTSLSVDFITDVSCNDMSFDTDVQ